MKRGECAGLRMEAENDHLVPLSPEHWPPEMGGFLQQLGNPLNIHSIMANHTALMLAWMPYRNHIVENRLPENKRA